MGVQCTARRRSWRTYGATAPKALAFLFRSGLCERMGFKRFLTTFDFVRADADAIIRCECGWQRRVAGKEFVKLFGKLETLESAVARLRCSGCGRKGKSKVAPLPHLA